MNVRGIEFAPLNVPLTRRLQTLAAGAWFIILAFGGFIGLLLAIYLIVFTRFWWLTLLYFTWIYYFDKKVGETGSRPSQWVRNWSWWVYFRDYFPLKLVKVDGVELDPKRNYLFCCFPHGVLSSGAFCAFTTNAGGFSKLFPHHLSQIVTLTQHYLMPFYRELAIALGGIASSAESINYMLSRPEGGHVVVLMPGGAAEAYHCHPRSYKIILSKRKGFVKLALKTGAPLVPVISFGETDIYEQLEGPKLRRFQELLRKYIGFAPVVPLGRGFFQYSYGFLPQRREIITVVGKPIDVDKIDSPTREQIEDLHKCFTDALRTMFETQKHIYLKNAQDIHLEIL